MTDVIDFQVPDHLPPLVKGYGACPNKGGCLMQVTNYLRNGKWTDAPAQNVMPVLQRIAIMTNDSVCHEHRNQLWRFVPRLMDTYDSRHLGGLTATTLMQTLDDCLLQRKKSRAPIDCDIWIRLLEYMLDLYDLLTSRQKRFADVDWSPLSPESLKLVEAAWNYEMSTFVPTFVDNVIAIKAAMTTMSDVAAEMGQIFVSQGQAVNTTLDTIAETLEFEYDGKNVKVKPVMVGV